MRRARSLQDGRSSPERRFGRPRAVRSLAAPVPPLEAALAAELRGCRPATPRRREDGPVRRDDAHSHWTAHRSRTPHRQVHQTLGDPANCAVHHVDPLTPWHHGAEPGLKPCRSPRRRPQPLGCASGWNATPSGLPNPWCSCELRGAPCRPPHPLVPWSGTWPQTLPLAAGASLNMQHAAAQCRLAMVMALRHAVGDCGPS